MEVRRVNTGLRLASMILDHFFMCVITVLLLLPFGALNLFRILQHSSNAVSESLSGLSDRGEMYFFIAVAVIYVCKDCINGQSIAKRILKLQVLNAKDNQPASPLRCIVRNLLIPIWPLEVILTLINPEKRLGDRIAGTKVTGFKKLSNDISLDAR